jgi:hypothetical protein
MKYSLIPAILLLLVFNACNKTKQPTNSCPYVPLYDGFYPCKGRFVHPPAATAYYQNLSREFKTYGLRTLGIEYYFNYNNTPPNYIIGNNRMDFEYNLSTNPQLVTVKNAMMTVNNPVPNTNAYDTCSGILIVKYSWPHGADTWEVCDTCYFH